MIRLPSTGLFADRRSPGRKGQRGLSIVELMVALTVSMILLAGVIHIMVSSRASYRVQNAQARLQENARFALDFLTAEMRMSGYTGCTNFYRYDPQIIANDPASPASSIAFDRDSLLTSFHGNGDGTFTPALPTELVNMNSGAVNVATGTDVLTVRRGSTCALYLNSDMAADTDPIPLPQGAASPAGDDCGFATSDILIVTDCRYVDVFRPTTINSTPISNPVTIQHAQTATPAGNSKANLSIAYTTRAQVMRLETMSYFIAPGANGRRALWQTDGSTARELLDGIQNLQILYGEDTNEDRTANRYVTPATVDFDPARVVSIRISLLAETADDNITAVAQTFDWDGATVTAGDRRLHQVFSTVVNLRNRTLDY